MATPDDNQIEQKPESLPYTIYPLLPGELHAVLPVLQAFKEEAGRDVEKNPNFEVVFDEYLRSGQGCAFSLLKGTDVVGCLVGVCFPDLLTTEVIAQEIYYYVLRDHRKLGRAAKMLFDQFETWARLRKATVAIVSNFHSVDSNDVVGKMFQKRGYHPLETHYEKCLKIRTASSPMQNANALQPGSPSPGLPQPAQG